MGKKKGDPGNPPTPFVPTDDQRKIVANVCAAGLVADEARILIINPATGKPVSKPTLLKAFREEIDMALLKRKVNVSNTIYSLATGQREVVRILQDGAREVMVEPIRPDTTAAIFWAKAHMQWRDGYVPSERRDDMAEDDGISERQRTHRITAILDRARERQARQAAAPDKGKPVARADRAAKRRPAKSGV